MIIELIYILWSLNKLNPTDDDVGRDAADDEDAYRRDGTRWDFVTGRI